MLVRRKDDIKANTIVDNSLKNTRNNINSRELNKFQTMHKLVESKLSSYLNEFRRGNYEALNREFTDERYRLFGLFLANGNIFNDRFIENFEYRPETFNSYRDSFHRILDGLKLSIINNNLLTTTSDALNEANSILNDPDALIDYYNKNYLGSNLNKMNTTINATQSFVPKEEYRIYLERHGFPENYIFDSEKLSAIRLELERINAP